MVVALIALFVSLGGVGYAATKIGTRNIKNGAVTAKKLHKSAVKTAKIASHAVGYQKVDSTIVTGFTPGVAIAGANIAANGTVRRYFNRYSSAAPTVVHPQAGLYEVAFPRLQGRVAANRSISLGTLVSPIGEIRVTSSGRNSVPRFA